MRVDLKSQKTGNVFCSILLFKLIAILVCFFLFSKNTYVFKENIFLSVRILLLMPVVLYPAYYIHLKDFRLQACSIQCISK